MLPDCGTVIKIFYALLQAASDRLPQQQEPHLVGFGISSRVRLDTPSLLPSSRLHLGLDCVFAVGNFLFSMQRILQYEPPKPDYNYWNMHFDGSKCKIGLGAGIVLTSPKQD